jgi:hypothetical protein
MAIKTVCDECLCKGDPVMCEDCELKGAIEAAIVVETSAICPHCGQEWVRDGVCDNELVACYHCGGKIKLSSILY